MMTHHNSTDHWRSLPLITLSVGPDHTQQVQQTLSATVRALALPPDLVVRLVNAVSNALLTLTALDDNRQAPEVSRAIIEILTHSGPPPSPPSWGFFLVEKRAEIGATDQCPCLLWLTIYLYQEGIANKSQEESYGYNSSV